MLSYMLPESTGNSATATTTTRNFNLSLNLNGSSSSHGSQSAAAANGNGDVIDETTKLLASERDSEMETGALISQELPLLLDSSQREDSFGSDASSRKIKMSKLTTTTTKNAALKR